MRFALLIVPMVAGAAYGLVQPSPFPEAPLRCTYRGLLPGSVVEGTWEIRAQTGGRYTIEVADPEQVLGLVRNDLGDRAARVLEWSLEGSEAGGALGTSRYALRATVESPGHERLAYEATVSTETLCPGMPREVRPGDTWECTERVRAGWRLGDAAAPRDSGGDKQERRVTWRYVRDQRLAPPGLPEATVAVLESTDEDGGHERQYVDPAAPWCPVQVERLKLDRVVGTDRLVAREATTPAAPGSAPAPDAQGRGVLPWLAGSFGVIALGLLSWRAIRRRRPPGDREREKGS